MDLFLADRFSDNISQILLWCLVLLGLIIVLCLGVWYYRRRWLEPLESPDTAWTLEDLRKLRDEGTITEQEFQNMRSVVIGSLHTDAAVSKTSSPDTDSAAENSQQGDFDLKK